MQALDKNSIMLIFALTECGRAIANLEKVEELAGLKTVVSEGVAVRENLAVFDRIRSSLQMAANVSRIFWPPRNKAKARGAELRAIIGLGDNHGLKNRTLRDHIEHIDERLDSWTAPSPRPFLTIELVLHRDYATSPERRQDILMNTAVVYDAGNGTIHLFGDSFCLRKLRAEIQEVAQLIRDALSDLPRTVRNGDYLIG